MANGKTKGIHSWLGEGGVKIYQVAFRNYWINSFSYVYMDKDRTAAMEKIIDLRPTVGVRRVKPGLGVMFSSQTAIFLTYYSSLRHLLGGTMGVHYA